MKVEQWKCCIWILVRSYLTAGSRWSIQYLVTSGISQGCSRTLLFLIFLNDFDKEVEGWITRRLLELSIV